MLKKRKDRLRPQQVQQHGSEYTKPTTLQQQKELLGSRRDTSHHHHHREPKQVPFGHKKGPSPHPQQNSQKPRRSHSNQKHQKRYQQPPRRRKSSDTIMIIEHRRDYQSEEILKRFENELKTAKDFKTKKNVIFRLIRQAKLIHNNTRIFTNFLYYAILSELQNTDKVLEKNFWLSLISRNLKHFQMKGEFKSTFIQALHLVLSIEEREDSASMIMEVMREIVEDSVINDELRYELVEDLHMRLYSSNFNVKKNALGLIFALTKNQDQEFLVVFKKIIERCVDTKNEDLIRIFVQNLANLKVIIFSDKLCKLVIEIVINPLFSKGRENMLHLLRFLENILETSPCIDTDLSKTMFLFFCKNMRSLEPEVRRKSVSVFSCMNLRQIDEEMLQMCLKREKFSDYQTAQKKKHGGHKKHRGIESKTEKIVNGLELKTITDNIIIGSIHHVLEDEMPEIRTSAIKALESLGKIFPANKTEQIKELLLYFLNDDFDEVRIRSLQALHNLFSEIALTDFEIDTLQFNLKENLYELRVSIYKLLCSFMPSKARQVTTMLKRLVNNLKLYREDAPWIYITIKRIFEKNKRYQIEVLSELLFKDQADIVQEKDTRNPETVVRIILLSNALKYNQGLLDRYPHYFKKQVILLKETHPKLIYDMDNDDNNAVISMKNSIIGDDLMRSFVKSLNEQVRGRENFRLKKLLKNLDDLKSSSAHSRSLQMVKFCDKLIRVIKEFKMELSSIMPNKQKILALIFEMFIKKSTFKMSHNLKKYLCLCEAFLWIQYLYVKIKKGQLKKRINVNTVNTVISALYSSASSLSKEDKTGQLTKLCGFLQPLLSSISHHFLLNNTNLLSLFLSFTNEFSIQEFSFQVEDFSKITKKSAFIHPKDDELEVIEVIPRYPFNFCVYVETDFHVRNIFRI